MSEFDAEIPEIEIVPGWIATELSSFDECDDAAIKVNAIIAEIEYQIDMFEALPEMERDYAWLARARKALKFKKIAAQCVNNCRSRLNRIEKQRETERHDAVLLRVIRNAVPPDRFAEWVSMAEAA